MNRNSKWGREDASALLTSEDESSYGIVAFSHLRWSFVWQRPQQFLSRFAHTHPVLYVEEPIFDLANGKEPWVELSEGSDNVTIAVPHLDSGSTDSEIGSWMRKLTKSAIESVNAFGWFDQPLLWYYSPMMAAWSLDLPSTVIVYDCMDELSQFKFAPIELADNEARLIAKADVLFTGGRELLNKKGKKHSNAHFFGCGVDYAHFSRAQINAPVPEDVRSIRQPLIGWFGVIDERVDYELIAKVANLRPEYSFVLIGPVVKVDPNSFPKAANIHWLGGRDYKQLPDYCRAFDACMMCFALNEATEFINPTKALEYLATGKPVVSTPVSEVVRQYSDVLDIAKTPEEFARAVDLAIQSPNCSRIQKGIQKARKASWESTVAQMQSIIGAASRHRTLSPNIGSAVLSAANNTVPGM